MSIERGVSQSGIPIYQEGQNLQKFAEAIPFLKGIPEEVLGPVRDALVRPEKIAQLPPGVLSFISALPVRYIEKFLPGYTDGKYFFDSYNADPNAWIPNAPLMDKIIYAGEGSKEGLRKRVNKRIEKLHERFPSPSWRPYVESNGEVVRMSTHNIKKVLNIVDRFMSMGENRRTGEEGFAHILRIVDRGIDYINNLNELSRNGTLSLYFTPEVAEIFLIVLATHDFSEDRFKQHATQNRDTEDIIRQGSIQSRFDSSSSIPDGVELSIIEYSESTDKKQIPKDVQTVEQIFIEMNFDYIPYFMRAAKALNSNNFPEGKYMEGLIKQSKEQRDKVTLVDPAQMMLHYLAYIGKCIDRRDNQDTSTFIFKDGTYQPRDPAKIYDKAIETLQDFPEPEKYLMYASTGYYFTPIDYKLFGLDPVYRTIALAQVNDEINSMMPTHAAKLTLLGLNPHQMYKKDPASKLAEFPRQCQPF